jgi:hypothetical protein
MSNKSSGRMAAAIPILALGAAGCGADSLDENSSCRFLQADPAEQDKAVARVAEKLNVKGVQSPLARPQHQLHLRQRTGRAARRGGA